MSVSNTLFDPAENKWPSHQEITETGHWSESNRSWVPIFVLALALVALTCAGYFIVKKKNIQISQLFGDRAAVNTLSQRIDSAEGKLLDVSDKWEGLTQRMTTLEGTVSRNIQQDRKYAQGLTEQLHQQIRSELETRTSALNSRLGEVESEQSAQRTQLAQVEGELRHEITSGQEETARNLSGMHQEVETNSRNLNSLSQRLDRKRVDFEVTKGRTTELVPGVELKISGANNRRFRGSLELVQDRRTLWLHDESVNQPVRFYYKEGGEPYELIVTEVTQKHSIVGYLLVPVQQQPTEGASSDTDNGTRPSASGSD